MIKWWDCSHHSGMPSARHRSGHSTWCSWRKLLSVASISGDGRTTAAALWDVVALGRSCEWWPLDSQLYLDVDSWAVWLRTRLRTGILHNDDAWFTLCVFCFNHFYYVYAISYDAIGILFKDFQFLVFQNFTIGKHITEMNIFVLKYGNFVFGIQSYRHTYTFYIHYTIEKATLEIWYNIIG